MTVTAQTSSNSSTGNGVTTVFPYTFKIIDDGDIEVRVDGVLQTLSTHYTVSGVGDNAGGNVTMLTAPANGAIVARRRNMALVREVDYQYQGNLPAAVLNPDQDAPILMAQQLQEQIGRSLRGPAGETWTELAAAADRLDLFPVFDATTGALELSTVTQTQVASAVAAAYAAGSTADAVTFLPAGTGATSRTVQAKLREISVSDVDFGCVGDGVTDDTTALTNFFNSAIANPGVLHTLRALTYIVTAELPTINVSRVRIRGAGTFLHNSTGSGTIPDGCVLKWTGAAGGTMQQITSVSGASNLKITNVEYQFVTFDCNLLANYGLKIYSVDWCDIHVGEMNARTAGVYMGVVAALDDAKDCQNNTIRVLGRQVEYATGAVLTCQSGADANISLNRFYVDCVHKDDPAIQLYGNDNNDWLFVRTFMVPGGAATTSVNCNGGNTALTNTRSERFHYLIANKALYAIGTEGGISNPAINIQIFTLDKENGTPNPTVGTGASCHYKNDSTPFGDTPWVAYAPTITANAGTFTTVSASGRYLKRGRMVDVSIVITITTNGTASSAILATLPFTNASSIGFVFSGKETVATGYAQTGIVNAGASSLLIQDYAGTYSGGDGRTIVMSGYYEIA